MKLLFITHNASRSGAPLVLLYFMRWIKKHHSHIEMDILYVSGGVLEPEFNALCSKSFHYSSSKAQKKASLLRRVFNKILKKISVKHLNPNDTFFKSLADNTYDVVYANSVVSLPLADNIKQFSSKTKLIVHVHELQTIIKTLVPNFRALLPKVDHYIAVSEQVKENLITNWNISPNLITVIYEFGVLYPKQLKSNPSTFIVGASGLSYWRKGNDVFLQVARFMKKHYPNLEIGFKWVGNEYLDKPIIDADINKLGLHETVEFVGEIENPEMLYNEFDVFLLLSREDPFPLVCIEMAHLKTPIICFDKASGSSEVIKKGGGFVVRYLDVEAVCEKIVYYYQNRDQLNNDGETIYKLFKDFTPDKICPQLFEVINDTYKEIY